MCWLKDLMEGVIVVFHSLTDHTPNIDNQVGELEWDSYQVNSNPSCFDSHLDEA